MGLRDELQRKIDKKASEIEALEEQLIKERAYLQGLTDALKFTPVPGVGTETKFRTVMPKPGSTLAMVREEILKAGRPLHIKELLTAMGKPTNKATRASLAGSLGFYVRDSRVFCKTAPNTYGLIELDGKKPDDGAFEGVVADELASLHFTN